MENPTAPTVVMQQDLEAHHGNSEHTFPREWEELQLARLNTEFPPPSNKQSDIVHSMDTSNVLQLSHLARSSHGLLSASLRAKIWPLLLGFANDASTDDALLNTLEINDCEPHKDEDQVLLDIKRLFTLTSHLNSFSHEMNSSYTTILSLEDIEALRKRLYCLILRVLRKYPCLNYYQGFHDVASVVLMVCNDLNDHDDQAFALLESLSLYHLRDFMNPHMGLSINHLKLVPLILEKADPTMFQLIRQTSSSYTATYGAFYDYKFYPALLAIITMFSHDMVSFNHVMLIWDFIFSYGSISVSAYIYVSFIVHFRPKVLQELGVTDLEELETADADLIHKILSPNSLFANASDSDVASILNSSAILIENWPLEKLFADNEMSRLWFKEFNTNSVVETSSKLCEGEANFEPPQKKITSSELKCLVELQEKQQIRELLYETDLYLKAIEQDSLATSINSLDGDSSTSLSLSLLTSSLSNLTAVSSSINNRLSYTSSIILKKLSMQTEEQKKDKLVKRDHSTAMRPYVFKISLTIGLVGFLLHFLLKSSDVSHGYSRIYLSLIKRAGTFFSDSASSPIISHVSKTMGEVMSSLKDSDIVKLGRHVSEVGLGSVRKSVFAFEKLT